MTISQVIDRALDTAAPIAIPAVNLTAAALRGGASNALAAGLKDAGNPAVARVEAALRKVHEARITAVRSAAPQLGSSLSASHDGRRLAIGLRRHVLNWATSLGN